MEGRDWTNENLSDKLELAFLAWWLREIRIKTICKLWADYRIISGNLQERNMTLEIDNLVKKLTPGGFG